MKLRLLTLALSSLAGAVAVASPSPKAAPLAVKAVAPVAGEYVEVRTASVFAGACHYNGERMAGGRDAVMAWNVTKGAWNGVDLTGVRAAAAVSAEDNLDVPTAARRSEIVIDAKATDAQASALADLLRTRYASALGLVISVTRAPVEFRRDGETYKVSAKGFASAAVEAMPDHACCKQPNLVWYSPLVSLDNRRVGFTASAGYTEGKLTDAWQRSDENSAFYGDFSVAN